MPVKRWRYAGVSLPQRRKWAGTAPGTFQCYTGRFTVPTATPPTSLTISGLPFAPKGVLFWGNICHTPYPDAAGGPTPGSQNAEMCELLLGMADGTSQASVNDSDDFQGGAAGIDTTHCISIYQGAAHTQYIRASMTSLNSDGFTLSFDTINSSISPTGALAQIYYMALGGSGLQAKIISGSLGTSATNVSFTGTTFTPTGFIAIGGVNLGISGTGLQYGTAGIGMVSSTTQRAAFSSSFGISDPNINPPGVTYTTGGASSRYNRIDKAYVEVWADAKRYEADLVSMNSNGFTLSLTTAPTATPSTLIAMCLGGVRVFAGSFTQKTSTGLDPISGVGFKPVGSLFGSTMKIAGTTLETGLFCWAVGGAAGSSGSSGGLVASSSINNPVSYSDRVDTVSALLDSATYTVLMRGSVNSFTPDGFIMNYTTADATARQQLFLAIGSAPPVTANIYTKSGFGDENA